MSGWRSVRSLVPILSAIFVPQQRMIPSAQLDIRAEATDGASSTVRYTRAEATGGASSTVRYNPAEATDGASSTVRCRVCRGSTWCVLFLPICCLLHPGCIPWGSLSPSVAGLGLSLSALEERHLGAQMLLVHWLSIIPHHFSLFTCSSLLSPLIPRCSIKFYFVLLGDDMPPMHRVLALLTHQVLGIRLWAPLTRPLSGTLPVVRPAPTFLHLIHSSYPCSMGFSLGALLRVDIGLIQSCD